LSYLDEEVPRPVEIALGIMLLIISAANFYKQIELILTAPSCG
jgi:hypothetical protein